MNAGESRPVGPAGETEGSRVRFICSVREQDKPERNTLGTVMLIEEDGALNVLWDDGSVSALLMSEDTWLFVLPPLPKKVSS